MSEFYKKLKLHEPVRWAQFQLFEKLTSAKLIPNLTRKTIWLLIYNTNMKKFTQKKCRKMFLHEAIFFGFEKMFFRISVQNFCHCLTWYHHGLQNFSLSFCQSYSRITICNLHWCNNFFTSVTHLNCTALRQSESSKFFHVYAFSCSTRYRTCSLSSLMRYRVKHHIHKWACNILYLFSCSTWYLSCPLHSLVRYQVEHEKRNSISTSSHVLFCSL